ncbi:MAG: hypothetical protein GY709_19450, partial [Herbaspirillum sp.]|nr:hypothetical protein [Herbaspirillum sp.]
TTLLLSGVRNCGYGRNSSPTDRLISVAAEPSDLPDGMILSCFTKAYGLNPVTRYEYDDNGNLRHQYDPRDLHTEFVYDELNRREYHIQPDSLFTNCKYDEEGNLKSVTDPNKNTVTYDYDELNRKTDAYYPEDPDSPFISTVSIHTDYDGNNNVTMITEIKKGQDGSDITDVTDNNYDEFDRLDDSTQRGVMTDYKYDENGNRTEVSTLAGTTTYTYDRRNRLKTAVIGDKTTIYTYTQDGKTDTVTY